MKKILRQVKFIIIGMLNNPIRSLLTCIGIILATAFYLSGNTIVDSFLANELSYYDSFYEDTLFIKDASIDTIKNFDAKYGAFSKYTFGITYNNSIVDDDGKILLSCSIDGIIEGFQNYPRTSVDIKDSLEYSSIMYGRYINENDCLIGNPVMNIHNSFAKLLFRDNPLGKTIKLNNGQEYEIVGVLNDTPDVLRRYNDVINGSSNEIKLYTSLSNLEQYAKLNYYIIARFDNLSIQGISEDISSINPNLNVFSKQKIVSNITLQQQNIKRMLSLLSVIIVLISCLIIMITMLFNLKERIFEFGIKMAIGADKDDISFGIIFEGYVYSFIGILLGIILGLIVSIIYSLVLYGETKIFRFTIDYRTIFIAVLLPLTSVLIFSLIPAIITSKNNIVDCLKVE